MEELLLEIYMRKDIKFCSGCLHTEDITKLSNMQTFGWVFTHLFTKLYLIDELQASFICSWCIRRLENARKLLHNFQRAQEILTKIADMVSLRNGTNELKNALFLHINDLKIESRFQHSYEKNRETHEVEIKIEDVDDNNDIDDEFDENFVVSGDERNLRNRLLRSMNVSKKKSCEEKRQSKKEFCESKKHKRALKHEKSENINEKTDVKNNMDSLKYENNVFELESREETVEENSDKNDIKIMQLNLNTETAGSGTEEVSLSMSKIESKDSNLDIHYESKSHRKVSKSGKKKKKNSRGYLPNISRISCTQCDMLFIKEIALENHIAHNHKKKYPCDKCDRIFTKEECLKIHAAKVHEPKIGTYECDVCATVYKQRVKMVQHMIQHQKYGPSLKDMHSIICHHCGKVCSRKNIKIHLLTHSDEKPYHCVVCNRYFKGALALENHTKRNHEPDIGKQFECPHCPKKFYLSSDVRCHVHAVHFFKSEKCLVCSKSFRTVSKLREHVLRVHEKVPAVRDKQCEFCDKAFSTNRQLKHHRYTHTGEKPYKCDLCTSAYNQKHCLVMHKLRAHNIEKPIKSVAGDNVVVNEATATRKHRTEEISDNLGSWYTVPTESGGDNN